MKVDVYKRQGQHLGRHQKLVRRAANGQNTLSHGKNPPVRKVPYCPSIQVDWFGFCCVPVKSMQNRLAGRWRGTPGEGEWAGAGAQAAGLTLPAALCAYSSRPEVRPQLLNGAELCLHDLKKVHI